MFQGRERAKCVSVELKQEKRASSQYHHSQCAGPFP